ncbi:hypothetical protein C8J56DRAFT_926022 [Mycena floridula]|nr:hypothetical protein C8J56DRAFT_926022 [Mycena floridula]
MSQISAPKPAHLPSSKADSVQIVDQQPGPSMTMKASVPSPTEQKASRLRGGCVPCPDGSICYIIPIPCCCC